MTKNRDTMMDSNRLVNALAARIDAHIKVAENASRANIEALDRWGDEFTEALRELIREEIAAATQPA